MKKTHILVLGASGRVGIEAVNYLLETTSAQITLASRSSQAIPQKIAKSYKDRIGTIRLDAMDSDQLQEACRDKDLVISCIGPSGIVGDQVASTCKKTSTQLVDAGGYDPVLHSLEQAEQHNPSTVPIIINVGLLPGLSGMFPKYVIEETAKGRAIEQLDIQYVGRDAWSYNSAWDIIHGIGDFGNEKGFCYFDNNNIVKVPMKQAGNKAIFPSPIGKVSSMLIYAEEIVRLARQYKINTAQVFGANIGPRAMFICLIAKLFKMYKSHKSINRAANWLVKASKRDMRKLDPAYGIQVDIRYSDESSATGQIVLTDTYQATGVTIGITARSVLEERVTKPGIYMLHEAIDDQLFMQRLEKEGLISFNNVEICDETTMLGVTQ